MGKYNFNRNTIKKRLIISLGYTQTHPSTIRTKMTSKSIHCIFPLLIYQNHWKKGNYLLIYTHNINNDNKNISKSVCTIPPHPVVCASKCNCKRCILINVQWFNTTNTHSSNGSLTYNTLVVKYTRICHSLFDKLKISNLLEFCLNFVLEGIIKPRSKRTNNYFIYNLFDVQIIIKKIVFSSHFDET